MPNPQSCSTLKLFKRRMCLCILPVLSFLSCVDKQKASNWEKPTIEGHWKFISAAKVENTTFLNYYPNPVAPAHEVGPPEPPYIGPNLIFELDTMYEVYGKMESISRMAYSMDSGYLHLGEKWLNNTCPVECVNDTLIIYKPFHDKVYIKESYVQTYFNDSTVNILKNHGVNYPALAGTWHLIREEGFNDGSEDYVLDFPHNIPDSIDINRAQFISGLENNMIYLMSTDGVKREYYFSYKWGHLHLSPGPWYHGEDPWIHFDRN